MPTLLFAAGAVVMLLAIALLIIIKPKR